MRRLFATLVAVVLMCLVVSVPRSYALVPPAPYPSWDPIVLHLKAERKRLKALASSLGERVRKLRRAALWYRARYRAEAQRWSRYLLWPVRGTAGRLIGYPYQGTHRLGNWQSDRAIDIGIPVGTELVAVTSGRIDSYSCGSTGRGGRFAGIRVTLHGAGDSFYYAHLSRLLVRCGSRVKKGQLIGLSGSANGVPHLHIARRLGPVL